MMILNLTKNQGFTLSLGDTFFEKPQGGVKLSHPIAVLRLTHFSSMFHCYTLWKHQKTLAFLSPDHLDLQGTDSTPHSVKRVQIRSYFWSVFSCIRVEYGDLRSKSPYSIRIQGNTDQK